MRNANNEIPKAVIENKKRTLGRNRTLFSPKGIVRGFEPLHSKNSRLAPTALTTRPHYEGHLNQ
jgi:hypothetical protein